MTQTTGTRKTLRWSALVFTGVAAVVGTASLAGGCPFVPPSRTHVRCVPSADAVAPLSLTRTLDYWHLRNDVEAAEEIGVRYGDSYRRREGRLGEHQRQRECTDKLLKGISDRHAVPFEHLAALRGRRPVLVDAVVLLLFTIPFLAAIRRFRSALCDQLESAPRILLAVSVLASMLAGVVAVGTLILFGNAVEVARLWDGHISYRGGRLPWEQHPLLAFAAAAATFWGVGLVQRRRASDSSGGLDAPPSAALGLSE